MKTPFARVGGKVKLKKQLVPMFPKGYEDMTYVEPFVGGGALFYYKAPSKKEVINDLDTNIYTIHKGLQQHGASIDGHLAHHYTKADFDRIKNSHPSTLKGKTERLLILNMASFSGMGRSYAEERSNPKKDFTEFEERLKGVIILNQDYKSVIQRFDRADTFFYLDPPYEGSTAGHYVHHDFDLNGLAKVLKGLRGKFMLSMNDSPTVRSIFKGFHIRTIGTIYATGNAHPDAEKRQPKSIREVVVTNY